jgi:hypothetical protein
MSNAKDVVLPDEFQYCLIAIIAFAVVLIAWVILKRWYLKRWDDLQLTPDDNVNRGEKYLKANLRWNRYHVLSTIFSLFAGTVSIIILLEKANGDMIDVEVSS